MVTRERDHATGGSLVASLKPVDLTEPPPESGPVPRALRLARAMLAAMGVIEERLRRNAESN